MTHHSFWDKNIQTKMVIQIRNQLFPQLPSVFKEICELTF